MWNNETKWWLNFLGQQTKAWTRHLNDGHILKLTRDASKEDHLVTYKETFSTNCAIYMHEIGEAHWLAYIYDFGFKDQFSRFSSGLTFPDDEITLVWETEWRWKIELGHYLLRQLKGDTDINYIGVQQETNSDAGITRRNRNSIHENKFIRWKVSPKLNRQS